LWYTQGWIEHHLASNPIDAQELILYYKDPLEALSKLFASLSNVQGFKLHPSRSSVITTPDTALWWHEMQVCLQISKTILMHFIS
jgi:hypothetical protein